jgi:hypothetical protein
MVMKAVTAERSSVSFCTFVPAAALVFVLLYQQLRQYLYFCTGQTCDDDEEDEEEDAVERVQLSKISTSVPNIQVL